MTIAQTDIKLMAAERLTDETDGGGMMSAVEVVDGVVNNLFPDISRLDRTYGRVNLRKAYPSVQTSNTDYYYGAHVIIIDAPDDPNVSVLAFTTADFQDERADAQDFIESYVVRGYVSDYVLYADQLRGARTLKLWSRVDASIPAVGDVYMLSEEEDGDVSAFQYVRITDVEHEIQTFEDESGTFTRRVYTLTISAPLAQTFKGPDAVTRYASQENASPTLFRQTQVADAARYYGIVKLAEDIAEGDMTAKAATIYGQLVPSAQVESPVVDVQAGSDRLNVVAAGDPYSVHISDDTDGTFNFGRAVLPNSVQLTMDGYASFEDDGNGNLFCISSGSTSYAVVGNQYGYVDYETGTVTDTRVYGTRDWTYTATPAAAIYETAHTASVTVPLDRGYNYVHTLRPIPQPGTLFVDYMVQGNWYRMSDNGAGVLSDEQGSIGTINYATGSVTATLAAIPDSGSEIIYTWASPITYEIRTEDPELEAPWMTFEVSRGDILPNTLTLTWDSGDETKTATDDGNGNLVGDAEGRVIYGAGQVGFRPLVMPDSDAAVQIEYDTGSAVTETVTNYARSGNDAIFTVADAPILPGSFVATFTQDWSSSSAKKRWSWGDLVGKNGTSDGSASTTIYDRGNGTLSDGGTIDYATGEITLGVASSSSRSYVDYDGGTSSSSYYAAISGAITVKYNKDSVLPSNMTESAAMPNLTLDLTPTTYRRIVAGSLEFEWGGKTYIDRDGTIYSDWNRQNGAATAVGTIDYESGQIALNAYEGGVSNTLTIKTLLTSLNGWAAADVYFRTSGAPLRTSSFSLRATLPDGTTITGTPNGEGNIDTLNMQGQIDYETGIVAVEFGRFVDADTLTDEDKAESWYSAENIDEGQIWYPIPVMPDSMKYNAVVYSSLPLDASILGLDPVRLPVDGRVPIIRSGQMVVIHSTKTDTLPSTIIAGQSIQLSRTELASVIVKDQNGNTVDTALYTEDREQGTLTFADPLDLSGYNAPLTATHRIEDMMLVNEAQINGQLSFVGAVSRDYSAADTWVSSALIIGDMGSRVHHLFSQQTWSSQWKDERSGNPISAQYNDRLYPIQIDNKNAIRERWACVFTSTNSYQVIGEVSGVIATGSTGTDCTPINPVSGQPYFTILAQGWGTGWSTNNVLRFNTDAAHYPVWIARTTLSGKATKEDDSFKLQVRGDAD